MSEEALNKSLAARDHPDSGGLRRWISCQYPDIGGELRLAAHPDPGAALLRRLVQRFLENSFVNRVLHKTLWAALLPACLLWAAASAIGRPADAPPPPQSASNEFPATWQGAPLRPLALSDVEQRFARRFPGTLARFAVGSSPVGSANSGTPFDTSGGTDLGSGTSRVLVLRHVDQPTRMLHPAVDCYQGLGYRIAAQQLELDREQNLWRCFEATQNAAGGQRLRVCERIVDAAGKGFTDTSAWYWAAAMGQSPGPWQAITVAKTL